MWLAPNKCSSNVCLINYLTKEPVNEQIILADAPKTHFKMTKVLRACKLSFSTGFKFSDEHIPFQM